MQSTRIHSPDGTIAAAVFAAAFVSVEVRRFDMSGTANDQDALRLLQFGNALRELAQLFIETLVFDSESFQFFQMLGCSHDRYPPLLNVTHWIRQPM
jgi:hypothetical protein